MSCRGPGRLVIVGLLVWGFVGAGGCGPTGSSAQVSGRVLRKGAPVAGVQVTFAITDRGLVANARTDESGRFEFSGPMEPGTYAVAVTPAGPESPPPPGQRYAPPPAANTPAKYHAPETSGLTQVVSAGRNEVTVEVPE